MTPIGGRFMFVSYLINGGKENLLFLHNIYKHFLLVYEDYPES